MTNNDIHFILENSRAKHPAIIQNGLQLFYDVKGKKDTDSKRNTLIDMSGNNRHGRLTNFAYKKGSGYQGGLVFDGVDDTLTIPALTNIELVSAGVNTEMKIPQFTYQTNNNIVSFGPEGLVRFVRDSIPYERKGINLVKQLLHQGLKSNWVAAANITDFRKSLSHFSFTATGNNTAGENWVHLNQADLQTIVGHKYLVTLELSSQTPEKDIYISHSYYDTQTLQARPEIQTYYVLLEVSDISNNPRFNITGEAGADITFRHFQVIDLTATYGVGNEPTLELIQQEKEKWVFMPNPQELREAMQLRGNIMGDLENRIDDALVDEVIGTSPVASTTSVDSVVDVEVQGQSYQLVQTGNENQFNTETDFWHEGGGSFEVIPDTPMGFHLIGGEELSVLTLLDVVKSNGDWTVSFEAKGSGTVSVDICDLGTKSISLTADWQTFSVTANVTNFDADWSNFVDFETTNSDVWVRNIKVETGAVKTPKPSPSPENPSPIININKSFDIVSSVGKENLFIDSYNLKDIGSRTYYTTRINEDGNFEVTGTRSGYFHHLGLNDSVDNFNKNIKIGEHYTVSFRVKSVKGTGFLLWYDDNAFNYTRMKGNITEEFSTVYLTGVKKNNNLSAHMQLDSGSSNTLSLVIKEAKLEKGELPTPWNASLMDIQPDTPNPTIYKTNVSLPEPLRSVGDVKDRLFRDSDGLWKVERKVKEKIFDGTETFGANITYGAYYVAIDSLEDATIIGASSNYLKSATGTEVNNGLKNAIGLAPNNKAIRMSVVLNGVQLTHVTIKSWLTEKYNEGKPLVIQYALATPTVETLPDDIQQKLNNIQSFNGTNYIYTADVSGLTPTLHASFKPEAWYKESLLLNSLKIYNRTLTASEMLLNYGTEKERWGL